MNKVTGGRVPKEYIPSVDAGAQETMQRKRRSAMSGNLSRRRRGLRDSCFVGKVPSRHRLTARGSRGPRTSRRSFTI
ncbi:hypothetical protein ABT116_46095 [Streptomyces sp. NPDC002130]|uniref:hypothetical protein n=1 Tax=Streptomyces sp. NPDC002130 TaxID=3155568 RepID=UPI00331D55DE